MENKKNKSAKNEYKYEQPMTSPLYNKIISPICDRIVNYLPKWLTPNKLTILGLISVVMSFILLTTVKNRKLCIISSLLWFLYGMIDNLDGKQARRLGMSSNSGEFLDHAIDSVVASLVGLTLQFIHNNDLKYDVFIVLSYQAPFYFACWFHFSYGKLIIGNSISKTPYFTVDELNIIFIPLFIFFEYMFPGLWNTDIHFFQIIVLKNWNIAFNYCCFIYSAYILLKCNYLCFSKSFKNSHLFFFPLLIYILSKELIGINMLLTIFPFSILCVTFIFLKISKILIENPNISFFILIGMSFIPLILTKFLLILFNGSFFKTNIIHFIIWTIFIYKYANFL